MCFRRRATRILSWLAERMHPESTKPVEPTAYAALCYDRLTSTFEEGMKISIWCIYGTIVIGIPLVFSILFFVLPDAVGAGRLLYFLPLLCLFGFALTLHLSDLKRKALHLLFGVLATPGIWFICVFVFGALAVSINGLEGTQ